MKWLNSNDDESNYEDRRGGSSSRKGVALGSIGTIVVIALYLFTGKDFSSIVNLFTDNAQQQNVTQTVNSQTPKENEDLKVFTLRVFNSCNDVWENIFENQLHKTYEKPVLVTYSDETQSGCGLASSSSGPFYCPADQKVYIDLNFFYELKNRFNAPGDLAMAYVTAHEMGHHVQYLLGITDQLDKLRNQLSETEYNKYSVRLELQADFFAGIWANYAQKMHIIQLEDGDIESALNAASAVGDDAIQKAMQGYVVPDAFTHGTSAQRMKWFKKGFTSGDVTQGDTFSTTSL